MTIRACVIGHPVAHSRSPLIHQHWLKEYGIDGAYTRQDVPPEAIERFFATFPTSGYVGANVTVPHKEAAFRALARAEPAAQALKAANTIWLEDGRLAGTNSDVAGFLAHLDRSVPGWDARTRCATVIGAGGAARAVTYALSSRGVTQVNVVNRTLGRAQTLARDLGGGVRAFAFDALPGLLGGTDLLVNATTLGMTGQPRLRIDLSLLQRSAAVYDIVYVPLETELLAAARDRGHAVIDGLGMLLHQAVPGFERWFGVRPQVTEALRARLVADLSAEEPA